MERFFDLLLILIPSSLVLFGMYLTIQSLLNGQKESQQLSAKSESNKIIVPLQLQAYERICLLLERISPQNLLIRLNTKSINSSDFQQVLINEIREEFNHNLSQQVYMSDLAWNQVKNAVEQTIGLINESAIGIDPQASGIELSKNILKTVINTNNNFCDAALVNIKAELRKTLF